MMDDSSQAVERGKRLRLLRSMTGLSKKDFCKKYGISSTSLHYWENAVNNGISEKGVKKVIQALRTEGIQCSKAWLLQGLGAYPYFLDARYDNIPMPMEEDKITYEVNDEKIIHYEIERFRQLNAGAITLAITDDGMEPFYRIGDYVGGKRRRGEAINKLNEQDCIIETEDKQLICRRLTASTSTGTYNLYCLNPKTKAYPPILYDVKVISVAPIVRLWRRNV